MAIKLYDFYSDSGHGWLRVSIHELVSLGIADKVTTYSYRKGNTVYLEEDLDAGLFINAMKELGHEIRFNSIYCDGSSPIRNYDSYQASGVSA